MILDDFNEFFFQIIKKCDEIFSLMCYITIFKKIYLLKETNAQPENIQD